MEEPHRRQKQMELHEVAARIPGKYLLLYPVAYLVLGIGCVFITVNRLEVLCRPTFPSTKNASRTLVPTWYPIITIRIPGTYDNELQNRSRSYSLMLSRFGHFQLSPAEISSSLVLLRHPGKCEHAPCLLAAPVLYAF